jgi:hypothetical protein
MAGISKLVNIKFKADAKGAIRGMKALENAQRKTQKASQDAGRSGAEAFQQFQSGGKLAAAAVLAVGVAFEQMASKGIIASAAMQNLPFAIDKARTASRGLVDDLTLQQEALRASQFGVAKTSEEYARLVKAATTLGIAAGKDATSSVQDLTLALGRQSPKILDNLNIMLKIGDANTEYAQRLGKTAAELTEAERKQAFFTIGLEKAEEAAGKLSIQVDQTTAFILEMKTAVVNLGTELSVKIPQAMSNASNALEDFIGDVTGLNDELDRLDALQGGQRRFGDRESVRQAQAQAAAELEAAKLEEEARAEIVAMEVAAYEERLKSLEVQLASTVSAREQNRLLTEQANVRASILEVQGKQAEAEDVFFKNFLRTRRFEASQRRSRVSAGPTGAQFSESDMQNIERFNGSILNAVAYARDLNAEIERFNAQMMSVQTAQFDRFADARQEMERMEALRQSELSRAAELASVQGDPVLAAQIEAEAFAAREAALLRQLDLESNVDRQDALRDQLRQERHQEKIRQIHEEMRAREEASARITAAIQTVSAVERGAFQLSGTIAGAAIKGEARKKRALDAIKASGLAADGAVAQAQAIIAFASGNIPQGAALQAAALNAWAQSAIIAAGNVRRGGGGGASGPSGSAFGGGGPGSGVSGSGSGPDRGVPISVGENPNNTSQRQLPARRAAVQNVTINAGGTIDRDAAKAIIKEIERFDGRGV